MGLMILLKDDIEVDDHGPVPLTPPLNERVMRLKLKLPSGGQETPMNVHTPNPVDRKVF